MNQDWEIRKRSDTCTRTQRPFREGEIFYTAIFREGDGFRREDVAEEVWTDQPDSETPLAFWRSSFELPPPPPPEPLAKQDAESILRKLIEENSETTKNARYILALMLERKRILKPMESADSDVLIYERAQTGETFLIPNPRLGLAQVPEIQREVSALLGLQLGAEAQAEPQAA